MNAGAQLGLALVALILLAGCETPQDIAGGAVQTSAGALSTAGGATVGVADAVGQAGAGVLGTTGEASAAVLRGAGEAATEATGGKAGLTKDVQGVADEIAKKRNVDVFGNEVVIDPSETKKVRMEF